jgi:hypothetical protein
MPGFIEKSFLKITQLVGLLFAIATLIMIAFMAYNKININAENEVHVPAVKFSDYQKLINNQAVKISHNLESNRNFDREFNAHINDIVIALNSFPDNIVDKADLRQKVKISTKVKLNQYPQSLQLAYMQSFAKLLRQVATVGAEVNVDDLTKWHDHTFFQKVKARNKQSFLQIGSVSIEKTAYSEIWKALLMFMLLVIMLAVLRIEKNSRKK